MREQQQQARQRAQDPEGPGKAKRRNTPGPYSDDFIVAVQRTERQHGRQQTRCWHRIIQGARHPERHIKDGIPHLDLAIDKIIHAIRELDEEHQGAKQANA